jgi:hypothetical protein
MGMMEVWAIFFGHFFGDGGGNSSNKSNNDVCDFSFLLQCSPISYSTCFELVAHA